MRLKLVPSETNWDFFKRARLWLGISVLMVVIAFGSYLIQGLNYGIDFTGGTKIRLESTETIDVGKYRDAIDALNLGDVTITEVFDPTFGPDQNVASITIQTQEGEEAVSSSVVAQVGDALKAVDPGLKLPFSSVESVGPVVSGELVKSAVIAVLLAIGAVLV